MEDFDAEQYWSTRPSKVWVVYLISNKREGRKKIEQRDTKIVRAKTEAGAIKTARYFSHLKGRMSARARLATPIDLGCVPMSTKLPGYPDRHGETA